MTHNEKLARQPLFWAALAFSAGIWTGTRARRPALWWMVAILALSLAARWFVRRRQWLAKALSLVTWGLLGALFIQVRAPSSNKASELLALTGDHETVITAHVIREGYAQSEGQNSTRQAVDLETEAIEIEGGATRPVRVGLRLTIYDKVADGRGARSVQSRETGRGLSTAGLSNVSSMPYGARLRVRAKLQGPAISAIPGPSTTRAICAIAASACSARRARRTWSVCLGSSAIESKCGGRGFTPASSERSTISGLRRRRR